MEHRLSAAPMDYQYETPTKSLFSVVAEAPVPMDIEEVPQQPSETSLAVAPVPQPTEKSIRKRSKAKRPPSQEYRIDRSRNSDTSIQWRDMPYAVLQWVNVTYHIVMSTSLLVLLYKILSALYNDYLMKYHHFQQEILMENKVCAKHYTENRCDPATRVPALLNQCLDWEQCMHRDPAQVASTKITASVIAEILESFVEGLSVKSMVFVACLVGVGILIKLVLLRTLPTQHAQPTSNVTESTGARHMTTSINTGSTSMNTNGFVLELKPYNPNVQFGVTAFPPVRHRRSLNHLQDSARDSYRYSDESDMEDVSAREE